MEESTWHGEYNQEEHRRKRRRKETEEEFLENFENKNIREIVTQSMKSKGIVQQQGTRAREQIAAKKPHTMKNCAWHALYDKYLHHDGTGKVNCSRSPEVPGEWNLLQHTLHGHANPPIPFGGFDGMHAQRARKTHSRRSVYAKETSQLSGELIWNHPGEMLRLLGALDTAQRQPPAITQRYACPQ